MIPDDSRTLQITEPNDAFPLGLFIVSGFHRFSTAFGILLGRILHYSPAPQQTCNWAERAASCLVFDQTSVNFDAIKLECHFTKLFFVAAQSVWWVCCGIYWKKTWGPMNMYEHGVVTLLFPTNLWIIKKVRKRSGQMTNACDVRVMWFSSVSLKLVAI